MGTGTLSFFPLDDLARLVHHVWGTSQDGTPHAFLSEGAYVRSQLDSATTATSSATGTTTTGLGGFRFVDVYIRMGTMTGTISTLDFFLDSRLDGTNYTNVAHLTQLTSATGGTYDVVVRLQKNPGTVAEVANLRADAGAGTVRNLGWGDDLRLRRDISGGTTSPSFSYNAWINCVT